jgi:hypothetical protein
MKIGIKTVAVLLAFGIAGEVNAWTVTTVDTSAYTTFCMAVNPTTGERNIVFEDSDADPAALYSLTDDGAGTWGARAEVEIIINDSYAGDPSCALDASNNIHLSYSYNHVIYHETDSSSSWTASADAIDSAGRNEISHLAVDSSGNSHVIYFDETNEDLLYSTDAGGSWSSPELVDTDSTHTAATYASIVIDGNDRLHVAYFENTGHNLMYATLDTTSATASWTTTVVHDQAEQVGQSNSIAVDADGNVHIAYMGDLPGVNPYYVLMHATKSASTGVWTTETVDSNETHVYSSAGTSIAIDAAKAIHIAYYDTRNTKLRYATNLTGTWAKSDVGTGTYYPSVIGAANDGEISLAYIDRANNDLMLAAYKANHAPVAKAGPDMTSIKSKLMLFFPVVSLVGSATDVDGDALTYKWTVTAKPVGSVNVVSNSTNSTASFRPDKAGTYELTLTATDSSAATGTDKMTITATAR